MRQGRKPMSRASPPHSSRRGGAFKDLETLDTKADVVTEDSNKRNKVLTGTIGGIDRRDGPAQWGRLDRRKVGRPKQAASTRLHCRKKLIFPIKQQGLFTVVKMLSPKGENVSLPSHQSHFSHLRDSSPVQLFWGLACKHHSPFPFVYPSSDSILALLWSHSPPSPSESPSLRSDNGRVAELKLTPFVVVFTVVKLNTTKVVRRRFQHIAAIAEWRPAVAAYRRVARPCLRWTNQSSRLLSLSETPLD